MDHTKTTQMTYICYGEIFLREIFKKAQFMFGISFSLKRALGISGLKTKIARKTGIPTTKGGIQRKVGQIIIDTITGKKKRKRSK